MQLLVRLNEKDNAIGRRFMNALLNNEAVRSFAREEHEVAEGRKLLVEMKEEYHKRKAAERIARRKDKQKAGGAGDAAGAGGRGVGGEGPGLRGV